jgi:hypothetical protein
MGSHGTYEDHFARANWVRQDEFSTRLNVASNRPNDRPWMAGLGRLATDGVVLRGARMRRRVRTGD